MLDYEIPLNIILTSSVNLNLEGFWLPIKEAIFI